MKRKYPSNGLESSTGHMTRSNIYYSNQNSNPMSSNNTIIHNPISNSNLNLNEHDIFHKQSSSFDSLSSIGSNVGSNIGSSIGTSFETVSIPIKIDENVNLNTNNENSSIIHQSIGKPPTFASTSSSIHGNYLENKQNIDKGNYQTNPTMQSFQSPTISQFNNSPVLYSGNSNKSSKKRSKDSIENDMDYMNQFRNMRLLLRKLLQENSKESNKNKDSSNTFINDPVLSQDPLFIHEKYLLTDIEESVSMVLNSNLDAYSEPHQFCQTIEAFMYSVRKQKDKIVRELLEIERKAVELVNKEGPDLVLKPNVMCKDDSLMNDDDKFIVISEQIQNIQSFSNGEIIEGVRPFENPLPEDHSVYNNKESKSELLSDLNVRFHLNEIYGRLKFLHSLVRRTREKYFILMNANQLSTPTSDGSSPSSVASGSPRSFKNFSGVRIPNSQLSSFILNMIYGELCFHESFRTSETLKPILVMLLEMFIEVVTPYLGFLDNWLFNGDISNDYSQEFIIVKNSNIKSIKGTSEYWSKFFEIRDTKQVPDFLSANIGENQLINEIILTGKSLHLMQYIEKENLLYKTDNYNDSSIRIENSMNHSYSDKDLNDGREIFFFDTDRPSLKCAFESNLKKFTSKEYIKKSGTLSHEIEIISKSQEEHESFFHSPKSPNAPVGSFSYSSPKNQSPKRRKVQVFGKILDFENQTNEQEIFEQESNALQTLFEGFIKPKNMDKYFESNIPLNLFSFSSEIDAGSMIKTFETESVQDLVDELSMPTLLNFLNGDKNFDGDSIKDTLNLFDVVQAFIPFDRLLEISLYAPIHEQYLKVSPYVVGLLFRHCLLLDHFFALRAIFFMESGDIMHFFSTQLFELEQKSKHSLYNITQLDLNSILQESLQFGVDHPRSYTFRNEQIEKFAPILGDIESINIFETIHIQDRFKIVTNIQNDDTSRSSWLLHYDVEYPTNSIITSDSIVMYNMVLKLLLEISEAKYLLDHIRLPNNSLGFKNAQLLLFQMRQFVNTLHQYIKTRIIEECWNDFLEEISEATDLDIIIHSHERYLNNVLQRCLLKGPPQIFLNEIRHILGLCTTLHDKCSTYIKQCSSDVFTLQEFSEREKLTSRLSNAVTRISSEFESHVRTLSGLLNRILKRGLHPELKDLEMRLDFSSFYSNIHEG